MSDSQNKTEQATPKRKLQARQKGDIPRSKETVTFVMLLTIATLLVAMSAGIYEHFKKILEDAFILKNSEIHHFDLLIYKARQLVLSAFFIFIPIFSAALLAIYFGNIALGGQSFSFERIKPKLSNIAPKNLIKKIFSTRSIADLCQSILKCCITGLILVEVIKGIYPRLVVISLLPINDAMSHAVHYILTTFLILAFSTFTYSLIDYPYQIYQNMKRLKMSKQEVRDEHKNAEGSPLLKRKIRTLQRKASRKRKPLRDLPKADLVITNPTHYAVALQYDEETMDAPIILALGANIMALHIRRLCTQYKIPVLEIPLLARALYHYGEVGEKIPEGLFYAVARVIAYIFKLDDPLSFHLEKDWIDQLPIPEELTKDRKK